MPKVASGDLFRDHQARDTELGRLARSYMERGELVPDDVTIRMVMEWVTAHEGEGGFLLDGFPRTLPQAQALDVALEGRGQRLGVTPLIDMDTEELVQRLAGRWVCRSCQSPYHERTAPPKQVGVCDKDGGELYQRDDDKPDVVRARLQTYEGLAAPLVGYYESQGKLARVNGQQDVDQVTQDLLAVVEDSEAA